jgi:type II secretory pathway pseudopilin PulG
MSLTRLNHKIYGSTLNDAKKRSALPADSLSRREGGYALVALLAAMTVLALFAMAAAPSVRQQSQRDLEKETIFRGEQVADAIARYYVNRRATIGAASDQALPTSIDDLLEGIPIPGGSKRVQILRASAARDPLAEDGEWRFVRPRSQKLIDFQKSVMLYAGNFLPPPRGQMVELQRFTAPTLVSVTEEATESLSSDDDSDDNTTGPFVGVTSSSKRDAVIYYYGIKRHRSWVFTPLFK